MSETLVVTALIYNMIPIRNFKIDGYELKKIKFDVEMYEKYQDNPFYYNEGLLRNFRGTSTVQYFYVLEKVFSQTKKENFCYESEEKIEKAFREELSIIERKLKLITNLDIIIPSFVVVGKNNGREINLGNLSSRISNGNIEELSQKEIIYIANRLKFNFDYDWFYRNTPNHVKRSVDLYFSSFEVSDSRIAHALLFFSLESLFNVKGTKIAETVSESVNKIVPKSDRNKFDVKKEMKKQYNKRSRFLHGDKENHPEKEDAFFLREIVRKVIICYVWIVKETGQKEISEILKTINENEKDSQAFSVIGIYLNDELNFGEIEILEK